MVLRLLRPTLNTRFVIDWDWFQRNRMNPQLAVGNQLCYQCRREFEEGLPVEEVDWVDSETAEVSRIDSMREHILVHCQWKPDYINTTTPLSTAIFRALLANNNRPLSVAELTQRLGRTDPETILRLLTHGEVKNGIVPMRDGH
ncbi:MAG TPA: hypothetical protein VER55_02025 [Ardenticatenaceae bacterium]|nr:hypothetical protein [Ardenticatenaceae bacterium]